MKETSGGIAFVVSAIGVIAVADAVDHSSIQDNHVVLLYPRLMVSFCLFYG